MKKVVALITLACLVLAYGCKKEELEPEKEVSKLEIKSALTGELNGNGDTFGITITSNVSWKIKADAAWVTFDKSSGKGDASVLASVVANDSETETRKCVVTVYSEDPKLEETLEVTQAVYVPNVEPVDLTFAEVIESAIEGAGTEVPLIEHGRFPAAVVDVDGNNLYVADEAGKIFMKVVCAAAPEVAVGDKAVIVTTGAKIKREANGSFTMTVESAVKKDGEAVVEPIFISADAVARYENSLVKVGYAQPAGSGKMTTAQIIGGGEFDVDASKVTIPSASGDIIGVVKNGKLTPRSAADVAGLTGALKDPYAPPFAITPFGNFFKRGDGTFANAEINSDKTMITFKDEAGYSTAGASIEKVGDGAAMTAVQNKSNHMDLCVTTKGWNNEGGYLIYTLPVNQTLYGDLEFNFSVSCGTVGAFNGDFTVQWSKDKNTWNDFDAIYSHGKEVPAGTTFPAFTDKNHMTYRQVAEFNIPEADAIASGSTLYFKVAAPVGNALPEAKITMRANYGFYMTARYSNTPDYGFENVLAMENFETCTFGQNAINGMPTYYFVYQTQAPAYFNADGWVAIGGIATCRGYVLLSDQEIDNYLTSPVLSTLTVPTDLYVTFKVAPYSNPYGARTESLVAANLIKVTVSGSGAAGEIEWEADPVANPFKWTTGRVKIVGANSDTQVNVGVIGRDADKATEERFYIDDIVISR